VTKILLVAHSHVLPTGAAETVRVLFHGLTRAYPGIYDLHQIGLLHCFAVCEPLWPLYSTRAVHNRDGGTNFDPKDTFGQGTLKELLPKLQPDVVLVFNEPERVIPLCADRARRAHKFVSYLKAASGSISALAAKASVSGLGEALAKADAIVTMTESARAELLAHCLEIPPDKVECIYTPADVNRFTPVSPQEKAQLREAIFPPWMPKDAFVLGWVGHSRWRKQVWLLYKVIHYLRTGAYLLCSRCERVSLLDWDPLDRCHLDGTKGVLESRPGYKFDVCAHCGSAEIRRAEPLRDVFLWLHMPPDDPLAHWPGHRLEQDFGVQRNQDIYYTEGYSTKAALPPDDMPTLYQLWDCLLHLNGGGSFGVSAWEAMCSGIPVVYSNCPPHAEYLNRANAGLPVEGICQPEAKTGTLRMIADVPQAIEAVRNLHCHRELAKQLGANGRAFVHQYRTEVQVEKWHNIFQRLVSAKQSDAPLPAPCA